jgi:hypothetical protein
MKKKLNLVGLSRNELKRVNGSISVLCIPGGFFVESCSCGCYYSGEPGGSSTSANGSANDDGGLHSVPRKSYSAS